MPLTTSAATYKDAKGTRVYVAYLTADSPTTGWDGTLGAPAAGTTAATGWYAATWHLIGGIRSDREESQTNTTSTFHYGEADGVTSASPPTRSVTLDTSYAPDNRGQMILRWAQIRTKTVGATMLYDGTNGYAVTATVGAGGGSGDAGGGLRAGNFTLNPIGQRIAIGTSDVAVPA